MKISIDGTTYRSAPHDNACTTCDHCDLYSISYPSLMPQCMLPKYKRASDYCESCAVKGTPIVFKKQ